jgi:hypothetical protein
MEPINNKSKLRRKATRWLASGLAGLFLTSMFLPKAEVVIGQHCPMFAWRHGTAEMQRYAAQVLIARIKPGMSYQQALEILGPGSADWPALKSRQLSPEEIVGFNVRADHNSGVEIGFRNGRVVNALYYD